MRRDVFQAIADPTRRAILSLLALQAMTPNAVATHFQSSRQAISKHIKILTECKLVNQEQTGREIYYHFNPQQMKEVDSWMQQFRAPDSREETKRLFDALSEGGKVTMPMEDRFWGAYFGECTDKYGINWMLNYQTAG
jgi:DNA-binding transcriptional ArsR family regulator